MIYFASDALYCLLHIYVSIFQTFEKMRKVLFGLIAFFGATTASPHTQIGCNKIRSKVTVKTTKSKVAAGKQVNFEILIKNPSSDQALELDLPRGMYDGLGGRRLG